MTYSGLAVHKVLKGSGEGQLASYFDAHRSGKQPAVRGRWQGVDWIGKCEQGEMKLFRRVVMMQSVAESGFPPHPLFAHVVCLGGNAGSCPSFQ
jgi:hypothetical protein